ncbi:unnamed protein product [Heligmosomoides polygyrus]|uniref:Reverse transcriptase domain-containing protein n=1 Tax=Heligmosomoides polygyrus TaxID=6339 RepID=A0A183GEL9_HELPZ|nr:unnamed protein product [Heligmosomoides polygyrus]
MPLRQKPIPWTLLYADDVMLACEDKDDLERHLQAWCDRLAMFGLKLNVKQTEYITTDVNEPGSIKIDGSELARTSLSKYMGSAIASDGSLIVEVRVRENNGGAEMAPTVLLPSRAGIIKELGVISYAILLSKNTSEAIDVEAKVKMPVPPGGATGNCSLCELS